MSTISDYQNFDVFIEKTEQGSFEVTGRSTIGSASRELDPPFSVLELQNLILRAGLIRSTTRSGSSDARTAARELGTRLFDGFLGGNVGEALRESVARADEEGAGVRIRLHLGKAPELAHYPWEFWNRASDDRFLVLSRKTPVVRFVDTEDTISPTIVTPPLRILLVVSDPADSRFAELDVEKERASIAEALAPLTTAGLVELVSLETASLNALRDELNLRGGHIVHFVGHGVFDAESQEGLLEMESDTGESRMVPGRDLGTMLRDHDVRLVVLNSCEGARNDTADPFAGAATSLVLKGIPAVIAMQFEITDDAAKELARHFYAGLVRGEPIDTALTEARLRLFGGGNPTEWATPVLYLQSEDGRLFTMNEDVGDAQELVAGADQAIERDDWDEAARLLNRASVVKPDDAPIAQRAHESRKRVAAAATLKEIRRMIDAGDLEQASALLTAIRVDYPDADSDGALGRLILDRLSNDETPPSPISPPSPTSPPPIEPQPTKIRWLRWAVAALVAVVVAIGVVNLLPGADSRVPLVTGLAEFDAVRILEDAGIEPLVASEESDAEPGTVIRQNPASGQSARAVTIVVSNGLPTIIPRVVGRTEDEAVALLATAGIEATTITRPSEESAGVVVEVVPPEGAASSGAVLIVSSGASLPLVPDVIGLTAAEATSLLDDLDIAVSTEERESEEAQVGIVVDQDPVDGERASQAVLVVGAGPGLPIVPQVLGRSQAEALAELDAAGVSATVTSSTDPNLPIGQVLSQMPNAGERSDVVALEISNGPGVNDYLGDWSNIDSETRGTTRLVITSLAGDTVTVAGFGSCSPTDCEWGTTVGRFQDRVIEARFDFGWKATIMTIERIGGIILVDQLDDYTESDGREDRQSTYVMSIEAVSAFTNVELEGIAGSELFEEIVSVPGGSVFVPLIPIESSRIAP